MLKDGTHEQGLYPWNDKILQALIAQLDQEEKAKLRESAETEGLNF